MRGPAWRRHLELRSESPHYVARSEQGERLVYDLEGLALFDPVPRHPTPSAQHVQWHSAQVFKTSA